MRFNIVLFTNNWRLDLLRIKRNREKVREREIGREREHFDVDNARSCVGLIGV